MTTASKSVFDAIYNSGLVPNEYIGMHVTDIESGLYTLPQLLADAPSFYEISTVWNNV